MFGISIKLEAHGTSNEVTKVREIISNLKSNNSILVDSYDIGFNQMGWYINSGILVNDRVFKVLLFLLQQADKEVLT